MKCKGIFFTVFYLWGTASILAQPNILNAVTPSEIGQKTIEQMEQDNALEPLPYGYTDDRDILWAKTTWEFIDVKQKVNFPLLYPLDTGALGAERKSLFHVLVDNAKKGKIKHLYADSYFNRELSFQELDATLRRVDTLDAGYEQLNAGLELDPQFIDYTDIDGSDLQGFRIRGYWYFDSRQGDLRYRLIGLAPVVIDAYSKSQGIEDAEPVELFWVFYPEVRDLLFHQQVFNPNNSAHPFNFDEILNARRFSAVVYKVDNEVGDRAVQDYIGDNSLLQLLESERLKNEIREFEMNMWNY